VDKNVAVAGAPDVDKPVRPMPIEDIFFFSIFGARQTVGHGKNRTRQSERWAKKLKIVGLPRATQKERLCDGAWRCSRSCWTKAWRATNVGLLLRGTGKRRRGARASGVQAGVDYRRTRRFKAEAYVLTKEEGRAAQRPFFLGVPAAVLFPDPRT